MTTSLFRLLPAMAAALLTSSAAYALQVVDGRDGVTVEASISVKEPTRIRLESGHITDVFGNVYSSSCGSTTPALPQAPAASQGQINPLGEVILECDREKGEIYVKPVGNGTKPVNLFVSSDRATYTLLLKRSETPADTIVIRDKSARQTATPESRVQAVLSGKSPVHIRALKTLLIAMAADRVAPDIRVEEVGRPVQLWTESRFTLMRVYEGRGLVGEKYLLTNVSERPMVLAEQEFDRDDGTVLGVSIENHNLRPGETTNVYVIRTGG
ncbi:MAG: type-F conjugative transfer system secretin TraK [Fimbriimonadaceae bacterium]|nr:type-F conjugative transfer system secretin TraK [Fimbriimonadaceae bacterium]